MSRPFEKRDHGEDRETRGQQSNHILLEKPMATKVDECAAINAEVKKITCNSKWVSCGNLIRPLFRAKRS
jgi:hypothetical protein